MRGQPSTGFGGLTERFDLNKPVIAAVNGVAMGGGFEIALACDLIIASAEKAVFALPEPRVGLAALAGGLQRLPRMIPLKQAMGMILTGRRVSAQEGKELGFVTDVAPHDELLKRALGWAEQMLECSPLSIRAQQADGDEQHEHRRAAGVDVEFALSRDRRDGAQPGFRRGAQGVRREEEAELEGKVRKSARRVAKGRRERIIEALCERMLARGFAATTLADVARAAHMTPSHLLYYFKGKEEILNACFEGVTAQIMSGLALLDDEPLPARLDQIAEYFFGGKLLHKSDLAITLEFFGTAVHDKTLHATKACFDRAVKAWLAHTLRRRGAPAGSLGRRRRGGGVRDDRRAVDARPSSTNGSASSARARCSPRRSTTWRGWRSPMRCSHEAALVPPDAVHRSARTTSPRSTRRCGSTSTRACSIPPRRTACTTTSWTSSSSPPRSASTASA